MGMSQLRFSVRGNYAGVGWSSNRLINQMAKVVNGKTNEVASREDLVAALQNNMLKVEELSLV